ncbi:MAG: VTT domain-containing protein [Candidatus Latescibacterota bacterium]|nr:VTT domain-containing protein [Candidatus Latescibacterota bacterium]MEE3336281.1 VTT domain-containing protein [Candidatus Latescibacterota bacterium]
MTPPDFIAWVQLLAKAAGSVGLALLSVADSAGIPTGGGPDVLLVLQASVTDSMTSVAILTLIAAVGSTIGCLFLYGVGRRSGRVALRRFSEQRIEFIRRRLSLHGPWVILLAVMAPPPYPTKLFILCAGVFGMRPVPLVLSTFIGRTIRYGMGGYLGMRFGAEGLELARQHGPWMGVGLLVLMGVVGAIAYRRRQPPLDSGEAAETNIEL